VVLGLLGWYVGDLVRTPQAGSDDDSDSEDESRVELDPERHFVVFENEVQPIMERYCYDCHMDGEDKGGLDLDRYVTFASMTEDRESWGKVKEHLELKLMPPLDESQPSKDEVRVVTDWIDHTIFHVDPVRIRFMICWV